MAKQEYTQEQLQHYLDNPEEVDATDTALVEALASSALSDLGVSHGDKAKGVDEPEPSEKDEDAKEAQRAVDEAEAKVAAEKAAEEAAGRGKEKPGSAKEEAKDAPVLTKDGKHTIPHEVLAGERTARQGAEAALAEANDAIVALADEVKALRAGKEPARAAVEKPTNKSVEELRALIPEVEKEAPWQVAVLEKSIEALEIMQAEITDLRGARVQDDRQVVQSLEVDAAEAFDNNPTLVLWKASHPGLYEEAVKFDKFIRTDEELREEYTDFGSRFNAAVEMVKARHAGQTLPLPEPIAADPNPKPSPTTKPAGKPSASDIQARAKAALDKASDESVRTLSDITGGVGEVAAQEALERMNGSEVAAKFAKMTPQQIVDWTMVH